MLARLFSKPCAYCAGHETGKAAFLLHGYPACEMCHTHFGATADRERLARVRSYREQRRGLVNRVMILSR